MRIKLAQKVLLKEKLVNQRLKQNLSIIKKKQEVEKHSFSRLAQAIKDTNRRITCFNL